MQTSECFDVIDHKKKNTPCAWLVFLTYKITLAWAWQKHLAGPSGRRSKLKSQSSSRYSRLGCMGDLCSGVGGRCCTGVRGPLGPCP